MIRPTTALLLVALAAAPALAGPAAVRTQRQRTATLDAAIERLDRLVVRAKTDPRLERIRAYAAFDGDQLKSDSAVRALRVDDLLEIVADQTAPQEIRDEAASAIHAEKTLLSDSDLSLQGKKLQRPRAIFSMKVLKLLTDNEPYTRALAKQIMEGLWPGQRDPDILTCEPRKKETCRAARTAWEKVLKK